MDERREQTHKYAWMDECQQYVKTKHVWTAKNGRQYQQQTSMLSQWHVHYTNKHNKILQQW